jgi:hypothetical protein
VLCNQKEKVGGGGENPGPLGNFLWHLDIASFTRVSLSSDVDFYLSKKNEKKKTTTKWGDQILSRCSNFCQYYWKRLKKKRGLREELEWWTGTSLSSG